MYIYVYILMFLKISRINLGLNLYTCDIVQLKATVGI